MNYLEYSKDFCIASYNTDFLGKVTVPSLLRFFQEIAWEHAELLGFGFSDLIRDNLIWALLRQKITIINLPKLQDKIKIKTWAVGKDKFFWYRDFGIYDISNNELVKSSSSWIIIDLKTRRPFRKEYSSKFALVKDHISLKEKLIKLPHVESKEKLIEKKVSYSDLDLNNHVNNAKYIEWILDSYPMKYFSDHIIDSVELNYISEAIFGDQISVFADISNLLHLHTVRNSPDNRELFRSRILWK